MTFSDPFEDSGEGGTHLKGETPRKNDGLFSPGGLSASRAGEGGAPRIASLATITRYT